MLPHNLKIRFALNIQSFNVSKCHLNIANGCERKINLLDMKDILGMKFK